MQGTKLNTSVKLRMAITGVSLSISFLMGEQAVGQTIDSASSPQVTERSSPFNPPLDLGRQSTSRPSFPDSQHDHVRSMSPDHWGQPASPPVSVGTPSVSSFVLPRTNYRPKQSNQSHSVLITTAQEKPAEKPTFQPASFARQRDSEFTPAPKSPPSQFPLPGRTGQDLNNPIEDPSDTAPGPVGGAALPDQSISNPDSSTAPWGYGFPESADQGQAIHIEAPQGREFRPPVSAAQEQAPDSPVTEFGSAIQPQRSTEHNDISKQGALSEHSTIVEGFAVGSDFRPDLGQRSPQPTIRNTNIIDRGEKFDHEVKKKYYPPMKEIIATGRFFASADGAYLRPHFVGNDGITATSGAFSEAIPFQFDNQGAPHLRFGFESKYGPGIEFNYFNIIADSETLAVTSNGLDTLSSTVFLGDNVSQLSTGNSGDTLSASGSIDLETFGGNFFKEIKFPISRLNGQFGFTYASIGQTFLSTVTNSAGTQTATLSNISDFRGYGPKFKLEYYRPIGHTPLEFITSFGSTGFFGRRDQFVSNSSTGEVFRRFGADEFITLVDFSTGVQYQKTIGENRSWFARVSFIHQSWLGAGTATDPQGDLGFQGFSFGVGLNR